MVYGMHSPLEDNVLGKWQQWFAWRPIKTRDNQWVWFKPVFRRKVPVYSIESFAYILENEYAETVFDLLKA